MTAMRIGAVIACSFERSGEMHHHSGRVVRVHPFRGLHRGEVQVRLFRPMRGTEPGTYQQSIILWEEEVRCA